MSSTEGSVLAPVWKLVHQRYEAPSGKRCSCLLPSTRSAYPQRPCSMPASTPRRDSDEEPGQHVSAARLAPLPERAAPVTLSHTLAPGAASPDQITSSAGACFQVELQEARCVAASAFHSCGCPLPASCDLTDPSPQSVLGSHPIWLPQEAPQTTPAWLFFISPRSHFDGVSTCFACPACSRLPFKPLTLVLASLPRPTWALPPAHLPGWSAPLCCSVWSSKVAIILEPVRNTASWAAWVAQRFSVAFSQPRA